MDNPEDLILDATLTFSSEALQECVDLEQLGDTHYRIRGFTFSEEADWGDIIEARQQGTRQYEYIRMVKRTDYKRELYGVAPDFQISPRGKVILAEIEKQGGYWEIIFGGMLCVAMPSNAGRSLDAILGKEVQESQ